MNFDDLIEEEVFDRKTLESALTRVGDLLQAEDLSVDLACCGGVISTLYFGDRDSTHDVDAMFPDNPQVKDTLVRIIRQVGDEMGLETGEHSLWFNDSISFFGLQTKSDVVIFEHGGLTLKAAEWEEMLAHKIHASRHQKDRDDAQRILQEIDKPKEDILAAILKYAPFVPHVPDTVMEDRFNSLWDGLYGQQAPMPDRQRSAASAPPEPGL